MWRTERFSWRSKIAKKIESQIAKKIAHFFTLKRFGPEKYPLYLRVPWIGKPSTNLENEVKIAVESCYDFVSTRLVFTSNDFFCKCTNDFFFSVFVILSTWLCLCPHTRHAGSYGRDKWLFQPPSNMVGALTRSEKATLSPAASL